MAIAAGPRLPAPPVGRLCEDATPSSRILAAIASRDRLIGRQGIVMESAAKVLGESSAEASVRVLMEALLKVADCERVFMFLREADHFVPFGFPFGSEPVGGVMPGDDIAGRVAALGEPLILPDVSRLSEFASCAKGYRSVLAMPVHDASGTVIAVMQAVNKLGGTTGTPAVFDAADERLLGLLLALTSHHIRLGELVAAKLRADCRTDTAMELVGKICQNGTLDEVIGALSVGARDLIDCQAALVFLKEQERFVCRSLEGSPLQMELDEPLIKDALDSGRPVTFDGDRHPKELQRAQELFGCALQCTRRTHSRSFFRSNSEQRKDRSSLASVSSNFSESSPTVWPRTAYSVLCSPMREAGVSGKSFGVIVAVNRKADLFDDKATTFNGTMSDRRGSTVFGTLLRSSLRCSSGCNLEATPVRHEQVSCFSEDDLIDLDMLLRLSAHFISISQLYEIQRRTTRKQDALLTLISDAKTALAARDPKSFAMRVVAKAVVMFECDRCTFFTVDFLAGELVGYFRATGADDDLQELRLPIKGIAGTVATENRLLNIRNAWADERFSNQTDLRTGYRTQTLLCAPLATSTGKVIAVLQCINKERGEFFSEEDEKLLETVSALLSDLLQRMMLEGGYASFIHSNDNINSDVKDMFNQYSEAKTTRNLPDPEVNADATRSTNRLGRSLTAMNVDGQDLTKKLRQWTFDATTVEEGNKYSLYVHACFQYFGLLMRFNLPAESLDHFTQALKSRYSGTAKYHNWSHAFSTLHACFLLLDSAAFSQLLPDEDLLGLLFASMGHDVEHPGFTNAFLVNTRARLAVVYNDLAVLESHHASVTNGILEGDGRLLSKVGAEEKKRMRLVIVKTILHTDMAVHSECIKWLETESADWNIPVLQEADKHLDGDKALMLASALLHSADLVHPSLPWHIHKKRSLQIAAEFFHQFEEETRLGLPTLPFMGKNPTNLNGLGSIQVGFIQFVATPLWSAMNLAAGNDRLLALMTNITTNKGVWKQLADGEEVADDQPFECPPRSME